MFALEPVVASASSAKTCDNASKSIILTDIAIELSVGNILLINSNKYLVAHICPHEGDIEIVPYED